jgi:hypothetical protein
MLDPADSEQGAVAGCCEHGDENLGSIESKEFLHYQSNYQLHKKDSIAWS